MIRGVTLGTPAPWRRRLLVWTRSIAGFAVVLWLPGACLHGTRSSSRRDAAPAMPEGGDGMAPDAGFDASAPGSTYCYGAEELCGTRCIDVTKDPKNCGACGADCPTGDTCSAGACSSTGCPGGRNKCADLCVDLRTNPLNCGTCGSGCEPPLECAAGKCTCTAPAHQLCNGVCTSVRDHEHCGTCDVRCADDEVCNLGACHPICKPPLTYCNKTCVYLTTDPQNCGACGSACKDGELCTGGTCSCPGDRQHMPCGPLCVDLDTNPFHCGACGHACTSTQQCKVGRCVQCVDDFFFCPQPSGGDAARLCAAEASNVRQECQCQHCLAELQACAADLDCVDVWHCAEQNGCFSACWTAFDLCGPQEFPVDAAGDAEPTGTTHPTADLLAACVQANNCGSL